MKPTHTHKVKKLESLVKECYNIPTILSTLLEYRSGVKSKEIDCKHFEHIRTLNRMGVGQ